MGLPLSGAEMSTAAMLKRGPPSESYNDVQLTCMARTGNTLPNVCEKKFTLWKIIILFSDELVSLQTCKEVNSLISMVILF